MTARIALASDLPASEKPKPVQLFHRILPAALVVVMLAATGAWVSFLGYGLISLIF